MTDEKTRSPEPEPEPRNLLEEYMEDNREFHDRVNDSYVVKGDEIPWEVNTQGRLKFYSLPQIDDAVLPEMYVFKHRIAEKSGRHTHQGGLILFGIQGEGATVVDDQRVEWSRGDLVLLPVKPGGITHQHFNRNDPDNPAEWLAIIPHPYFVQLGAELTQNEISQEWHEAHGDALDAEDHDHHGDLSPADHGDITYPFEDFDYSDWLDYEEPEETETLYDDLIVERNKFRKSMAESQEAGNWAKIEADQPDWEWNPQGKTKWYLHPSFNDRSVKNLLFAVQEIPPGSRSGKQHRQGGAVHFVLEGTGHSNVAGRRFDWEAGDYLGLPLRPDGQPVQHFNDDPENPARFIVSEPRFPAMGFDKGCGFAQLESCPEYSE